LEALCELLRPRDVAAGVPIVAETGGGVTNLDGSALYLDAGKILASNPRLRARCARSRRRGRRVERREA
jgi:fructose-1,6-bisphosphatase/inositol monophosphatase family enzyme